MAVRPRIVYVQYTNPAAYPPLEHSSRTLADSGWDVVFLGITTHGEPPLHWPPRRGIRVHQLAPSRAGWLRKIHYAWFVVWVLSWVLRTRPSYVYASDALACPVVLALSLWPRLKVVYHEHDAPQVRQHGLARSLVLWTRRQLARRAAIRVLPNEKRAEQFVRSLEDHRPTFSVWNCPMRDEVAPPRLMHRDGLTVVYVGSIVPVRLPPTLVEALALLPDCVRLWVIGYPTQGHPEYVEQLRCLAAQVGVEHRTTFIGGMPHADLLVLMREADVGVVLMPSGGDQWMPGASNKPFDYLASGLAVLVCDEPGWRELLVEPGYAVACRVDDAQSIARALRWLLEHPAQTQAMGERGRQRVLDDWNYETQFAPVQRRLHP